MKVRDVMTDEVKSCGSDTSLAEAVSIMWKNDCGTLPVIADDGRVIGMVTDRDLAVAAGTRNQLPSQIRVAEVMSQSLHYCNPDDDIHTALETMRREKLRRLPVLNSNGLLEGILSVNDIALHAEKFDGHKTTALSYEDVVNTMRAICEHRHPSAATEARAAVL